MIGSLVGVAAAAIVGGVLVVAGVAKLAAPTSWRSQSLEMGVSAVVAAPVPFVEIVLGAALAAQVRRSITGWFAAGLLTAFTAMILVRLAQGRRPVCMCFGSSSRRPIGVHTVVRNALLLAGAVVAAVV